MTSLGGVGVLDGCGVALRDGCGVALCDGCGVGVRFALAFAATLAAPALA